MKKEGELKKLNNKIENCRKCPLWKTRINAVPGEGPANAKIMILGEAPGKTEDKTGRPFCGRAGKLLDELLKANKINRKKVFITSALKCRPPKNRSPKADELKACRSWRQEQVKVIKPKIIILLGAVAFKEVMDQGENFKDFRGRFIAKNNFRYFPVYHPAAGLRFPKIKTRLRRDFARLRQNLDSPKA